MRVFAKSFAARSVLVARAMRTLAIFATGALAVGCSSYTTAPVATPPIAAAGPGRSDVATVCLYRPTHIGTAMTVPVRDNGQLVGVTQAYTYFCWHAEPGRHRVAVAGGSDADDRTFEVVAGERLHLQHEINIGSDALRIIDAREAEKYARECAYHVVTEAPSEDPIPTPERVVRAQAR